MNKKYLYVIFTLYLLILLKITVFRSNFGFEHLFSNGRLNLTPFKELISLLTKHEYWEFIYLFVGNIIWFVPFGFLIRILTKISDKKIVVLGFLLSLIIEISQFVFGTGFSEIDDLILNTLGTFIGLIYSNYFIKHKMLKNTVYTSN